MPNIDQYSDSSTQWILICLSFTVEKFGIKIIYDQIDTPHAEMCFRETLITHFVY